MIYGRHCVNATYDLHAVDPYCVDFAMHRLGARLGCTQRGSGYARAFLGGGITIFAVWVMSLHVFIKGVLVAYAAATMQQYSAFAETSIRRARDHKTKRLL